MHVNYNDKIRSQIKEVMTMECLNQKEVCEKTGIDRGDFSRFLRSKSGLGALSYKRLSTYLEMYGYNVSKNEEIVCETHTEPEENTYQVYDDLSLNEIDEMQRKLTDLKRKKIKSKLKEIEDQILLLYEQQESYEKLLKELE